MGSSQTRVQTRVLCIGRWIPTYSSTREVLFPVLLTKAAPSWFPKVLPTLPTYQTRNMNRICYYQIDFWINEVSSLCILVLMSRCKAFLGERAKLNISPERLVEKKEVKISHTVTGKERGESGTGTLRLAENFEDSLSESLMPIPRDRPLRKPRVKQVLLSVLRESSSFRTLQRRLCKIWDLFSSKKHKRFFIYLFIYFLMKKGIGTGKLWK